MQRKEEIAAKKARLAQLKRQREQRQHVEKRQSYGGPPSDVSCIEKLAKPQAGTCGNFQSNLMVAASGDIARTKSDQKPDGTRKPDQQPYW